MFSEDMVLCCDLGEPARVFAVMEPADSAFVRRVVGAPIELVDVDRWRRRVDRWQRRADRGVLTSTDRFVLAEHLASSVQFTAAVAMLPPVRDSAEGLFRELVAFRRAEWLAMTATPPVAVEAWAAIDGALQDVAREHVWFALYDQAVVERRPFRDVVEGHLGPEDASWDEVARWTVRVVGPDEAASLVGEERARTLVEPHVERLDPAFGARIVSERLETIRACSDVAGPAGGVLPVSWEVTSAGLSGGGAPSELGTCVEDAVRGGEWATVGMGRYEAVFVFVPPA